MTIQSLKHFQSGIPQDPLVTTLSLEHLRYKIAPLVLICPSPEKKSCPLNLTSLEMKKIIIYSTIIIPRVHVGYEMVDSQQGE